MGRGLRLAASVIGAVASIGMAACPPKPSGVKGPPPPGGRKIEVAPPKGVEGAKALRYVSSGPAAEVAKSSRRLLSLLDRRPDFFPSADPVTPRVGTLEARWTGGRIEILRAPTFLEGNAFLSPRVATRPTPEVYWLVVTSLDGRKILFWSPLPDLGRVRFEEVDGGRVVGGAVVVARRATLQIPVPDFAPAVYAIVGPAGEWLDDRSAVVVPTSPVGPP